MRDVPYIVHTTMALAVVEGGALAFRKYPPITEMVKRRSVFWLVMAWLLLLAWHIIYNALVAQSAEAAASNPAQ